MNILRFFLGVIALLFVWLAVATGIGLLIGLIFQPQSEAHFLWFWMDWHALPGLAIGLFMGIRAFRSIVGNTIKRTSDSNGA